MPINITKLAEAHSGTQHDLFARYCNPQLVKVLRTIGFDKNYTHAEGPYLYDEDGERYLDFLAGYGVFALGRNHPRIREEIQKAMDADWPNMVQMDAPLLAGLLAEQLLAKLDCGVDMVFFTNSGAEANEGAIKLARKATGKTRILFWDHAFHGLTVGALSLNGNGEFTKGFGDLLPGCEKIPMGDIDALEAELKKGDVAAFVFEPVQGKGVYEAPPSFYAQAQELCKKYGALLIADEIQCGVGRTGKWFAFQHWGLKPDIVTVAKALSGGFIPVGAICYKRWIYDKVFSNMEECVVHSNTFGRNTLAMTAGLATLAVMEHENVIENAASIGAYLKEGLERIASRFEMVQEVRGKGLMIAIEFGKPKGLKLKAGWNLVNRVNKGFFSQLIVVPLMDKYRVLSQVAGHNVNIVKILPPLIISKADADYFLNAFEEVVKDCHSIGGHAWKVGKQLATNAAKASRLSKGE
jgi:acetylornithine/succinyldiaminopimelate/putrescine aminotransferase